MIPAGTGNVLRSLRRVAAQNDKEILAMREAQNGEDGNAVLENNVEPAK